MIPTVRTLVGLALVVAAGSAHADEIALRGYLDTRIVASDSKDSALEGGLDKTRFDSSDTHKPLRFVEAVGEADWSVTPELAAVAVGRVEPLQRTGVDALEAYARYTPQALGDWQMSFKAGAFFPPISLENNDLGWTSPYTLTPSALNSWVGDELRTIGTEATSKWQTDYGTLSVLGALFCCNDPAGVLIADRGWTMTDRPTGLFEEPPVPDATLALYGRDFPDRTPIFKEFDGRTGWYAGGAWETAGVGRIQALYYDNEANPDAHDDDYYAWHTRFWSVGARTNIGGVTLLGQGLAGSTIVSSDPIPKTNFWASYALASYDFDDDWRLSARADLFGTSGALPEQGHAATASLSWSPWDWLRIAAEFLSLTSNRAERATIGVAPRQTTNQGQLSLRLSI